MRQAVPTEVVSTEVGLKRVRFAKPWSNEKPGFESKADDTSDGIKSIRNWSKELQPWGEKPVYLSNKVSYSNNDSSPLHLTLAKRLRSDHSSSLTSSRRYYKPEFELNITLISHNIALHNISAVVVLTILVAYVVTLTCCSWSMFLSMH